ncbi:MAG: hypothetical protein ACYCTF_00145 [Acidiferrobacter sp.]
MTVRKHSANPMDLKALVAMAPRLLSSDIKAGITRQGKAGW